MPNRDLTRSVINFVMYLFQTRKQFSSTKQRVPFQTPRKHTEVRHGKKNRQNGYQTGDMNKKMVGSIYTAKICVCITCENCKRNRCHYFHIRELYSKSSTTFIQIKKKFHKLQPNAVHDEEIDPTTVLFNYKAYFHLCK